MVIMVRITVRWNLAGLAANPGAKAMITHGMASSAATVMARVAAARVAMASAARVSATSSPSCSSDLA